MDIYSKLKSRIHTTYKIWCSIRKNYVYSNYLNHNKLTSRHSQYIRYNLFAMLIIELAKLFVDRNNHNFNLHNLIKDISSTGKYKELEISDSFVNESEALLARHSPLISEIHVLRDKLYAHTDPDFKAPDLSEGFWQKIDELVAIGFNIIFHLGIWICDKHFDNGRHLANLYGFEKRVK